MYKENEINVVNDDKINGLRSSISDLRDHLYVRDLKNNLKEFINKNIDIDESQNSLIVETIEGAPSWFPKANLSRTQTDLIATSKSGEEYIFFDYFTNHELPYISTENGLLFNGSLVNTLAGPLAPGQYVQAFGDGALSIGEVSSLTGSAKAIRIDGNEFNLSNGDPVFQGDTIEVSGSGAVGLTFLDKTTLSLSEGGKMVLDELVYDPATGSGSMAVDMVEGAFSFISGEIAKTGPDAMTIKTPVATVGIRGTTVAGKAAVEGNENSFTLLQDADGGVGQISVSNAGGTQVLGQIGATTSIASFNAPPPPPIILSAAQIQANYGTALNVLPPTPVVAPTPQTPPPPQEQQQEAVQEQAADEASDEEGGETSEEVSEEEQSSEEGEEELAETEEGLLEEEVISEEGSPEGEEGPSPEGEQVVAEEGTPEGDQQAAREAFDTAIASGASPEQAMAAAAAAGGGFDGPGTGGSAFDSEPLEELVGSPLGGDPLDPIQGAAQGSTFAQTLVPGVGGSVIGSPFGGPMNASSGSVMGPVFGMGPAFGPGMMNTMGQGPMGSMGGLDTFMPGAAGFGDPSLGLNPYAPAETIPTEAYFFEDPALYDDYESTTPVFPTEESNSTEESSSTTTQTQTGTSGIDTISKANSTNPWILDGLDGSDTLVGGNQNDIIIGGLGPDIMTGGLGDDKFYYRQGDADANIFDKITDFRQSGLGNDQLVAGVTQTSSYTRIPIYNDAAPGGSNYIFNNHSNQLPTIFNFTHDTSTSNINTASSVSSYLDPDFWVTPDGNSWTSSLAEQFILVFGDGNDTYTWLWEDTSKGGAPDASELYPVAILSGFDNDTMDGSEFQYQTISGV